MKILLALVMMLAFLGGSSAQEQPFRFSGAACVTPPPLHCPDADCPSDRVINQGSVVEMKTRRTYFLDYPCDLKPGEKVTFILSLHGGGSYGNWQRHYFPILDLTGKHRLVIATPNAPTRAWSPADDQYLQNIVEFVIEQIGRERITSFWLAGHSQGGMTSNRLLRTDFFKSKVDGWLSLSGGRLGGQPGRVSFGNIGPGATTTPAAGGGPPAGFAAQAAALTELPTADFSFIYTTGEREIDAKGVPPASAWAAKYGCGARAAAKEIADTKGGYIYDRSRQNPPNPAWGLLPGPGTAHVMTYGGCQDGRVVADVVRLAKGHTEGLEPNVTEELVRLMLSAKGGKLQQTTTPSSESSSIPTPQAPSHGKGRALAIEDYYRIKSVGDLAVSPNGRWVVYTVTTRVEEDNTNAIDTFVAATDGSAAPRRITHEGRGVAAPRWTDDGLLQYVLNARVNSAVFVGGDAPRERPAPAARFEIAIEAGATGATGATGAPGAVAPAAPGVVSFDGKSRALARDLPRSPVPELSGTDFEKRHAARFQGRTFDWMRFQQDGQDYPTADPRLRPAAEITVTALDGSAARALTTIGLRPSNVTWHPNGSTIAFTADENWRTEQMFENPDIYTVSTQGTVRRLTNDAYNWSSLAYSPDGQYLLAERTFGTGMIIDQKLSHGGSDDLLLWPSSGGAAIHLTDKWDLEPNAARWSADGRHVYFTAEKGGTTHVFRVAARAGAPVEQVTTGDRRLGSITFDKAMTRIAYTSGTYDTPSDVWTARIDGTDERRLTDLHADLRSDIGITRTERISWKSADGTVIEGFLTYPFGYSAPSAALANSAPSVARYPLVVFNHGGPHSAVGPGFNFKQQYFAANGYFVLDTNFRSSTGYGDAFKWATWGAWGNKDGQDVMAGIDYAIANYPIDRAKVATMGHSYGGFMTNWLITQYPDRFAAAASGAGISNWISDYGTADIYRTKETEFFGTPWNPEAVKRMVAQSPLMQAGRVRTPTLFLQGEMDQRVPYEESEQMYFALRRQGVPAKMIAYRGQPHGISGHWNNVHRMLNELKWIDSYVKTRPATTSASKQ